MTIAYDGVPETLPDDVRLHAHRRRRARRRPAARRLDTGSRSTTTRPTRRRTRSASRCPRASRRSRTAASQRRRTQAGTTTWTWDGARADGVLPRHARDRRVRRARLPRGRHLLLGRGRPATCSSRSRPRTGDQYALSQSADLAYKRLAHTITVPAAGRRADVLGHPRHRARRGTSSSSRRTPSARTTGRRCRTRTATRRRTPATSARTGSACTRSSSTTRRRRTRAATRGDDRRVACRERPQRRLRAVDDRPLRLRRPDDRARAHLRQRRHRRSTRASSSTTSRARAAQARRRSRTTATRWTAGPCRARPRAASRTQRLDRRHRRGRAGAARPEIDEAVARQPEVLDFLAGIFGPYPFSTAGGIVDVAPSASPLRRRPGRSTRPASSTAPRRRRRGRTRARPSVGRRLPDRRPLAATSGSTRASRPTRSGSGARPKGAGPPQEFFDFYDVDPRGRRSVLERRHRPPAVPRTCCSTSRSTAAAR